MDTLILGIGVSAWIGFGVVDRTGGSSSCRYGCNVTTGLGVESGITLGLLSTLLGTGVKCKLGFGVGLGTFLLDFSTGVGCGAVISSNCASISG